MNKKIKAFSGYLFLFCCVFCVFYLNVILYMIENSIEKTIVNEVAFCYGYEQTAYNIIKGNESNIYMGTPTHYYGLEEHYAADLTNCFRINWDNENIELTIEQVSPVMLNETFIYSDTYKFKGY